MSNLIVVSLLVERISELNFLGERLHAANTLRGSFGVHLLRVAFDVPVQRHDALLDGYADILSLYARVEVHCVDDILP
jgi:hypothetical protein